MSGLSPKKPPTGDDVTMKSDSAPTPPEVDPRKNPLDISKNIGEFFSTPILFYQWPDSDVLNAELREFLLAKEAEDEGLARSNVGGWHSDGNFFDWDAACVRATENRVIRVMIALSRAIMPEHEQKLSYDYHLFGWANINRHGSYSSVHNHPNWIWSGIYYVATGEPEPDNPFNGRLEFLDPRTPLVSVKGLNRHDQTLINPQPGQMLVFPSWLNHQVHPFFGKGERISIAFNVFVRESLIADEIS